MKYAYPNRNHVNEEKSFFGQILGRRMSGDYETESSTGTSGMIEDDTFDSGESGFNSESSDDDFLGLGLNFNDTDETDDFAGMNFDSDDSDSDEIAWVNSSRSSEGIAFSDGDLEEHSDNGEVNMDNRYNEALKKAKPSVNQKDLGEYVEWTKQFGVQD